MFKKIMLLLSLAILISSPVIAVETSTAVSTNCEITQKDFLINFTIQNCNYNGDTGEFEINIASEPYSYTKQLIQMAKEKKTEQEIWEAVKKYATPQYKIHTFEIIDKTMIDEKLSNATNVFYYNTYKTKSYQTITYLPEWCEMKREYSGYADYYNEIAVCEPYTQLNLTNAQEIADKLLDYPVISEVGISSKSQTLDYFASEKQVFELRQEAEENAVTHLGSESAIVQSTVGTQQNITNGLYTWEWDTSTDSGKFWFFDGDDFLNFAFDTNTVGATSAVSAYGDDTSQALNVSDIDGTGDWFSLNMTRGLHPFIQIFANDATPKSYTFTHGDLTPTKAYLPGYAYYDSGDNADQVSDLGNNWFLIWDASNGLIFSLTDSADLTAVDDIQVKFDAGETIVYAAGDSNERIYLDWLNTTWADFHTNSDNPTTKYSGKPVSYYEVLNESFDVGEFANETLFNSGMSCQVNTSGGARVLNRSIGNPCNALQVANASIGFEMEWRAMYPLQGGGNVPLVGLTKTGFVRAVEVTYNTDDGVACRFPLDNTTIITQDISAYVENATWHTFKIIQPNDSHQEVWVDGSQRCKNIQDSITGSFAFSANANTNSPVYIDWVRIQREVIPDMIDGQGGEYQDFDFSAATLGVNKSLGEWFGKSSLLLPTFTYQENGTINGTYALATNDFYTLHDMSENYVIQLGTITDPLVSGNYVITPAANMSIGTGSNDTFFIHNLTTLSLFFLQKMVITIDDPQAIEYFTNNNTVDFTTSTNWFAGTFCWRQLDGGGWVFIGNITNNTQSVSYFQDNVTQSQVFDIQCEEIANITESVTYTQSLSKTLEENVTTDDLLEGESFDYAIKYIINRDLVENVASNFTYDNVGYSYDDSSSVVSGLVSGGTNYTFDKTLCTPIIGSDNATFGYFWNLSVDLRSNGTTFYNLTENRTHTVHKMNIDACTDYPTVTLNLTNTNEKTLAGILGNVELRWNFTMPNGTYANRGTASLNKTVHQICIYPNWINREIREVDIRFNATDYESRTYFLLNTNFTNSTEVVDLYFISADDGQKIDYLIIDDTNTPLESVYLEIQRFYRNESRHRTVEIAKTDFDGKVLAYLEPNVIEHAYVIRDADGTILDSISGSIVSYDGISDPEIQIIISPSQIIESIRRFLDTQIISTFSHDTNTTSITVYDPSNDIIAVRLLCKKRGSLVDTIINDTYISVSAGSTSRLSCTYGEVNGSIFYYQVIGVFPEANYTMLSVIEDFVSQYDYSNGALFGVFMLIFILAFRAQGSKTLAVLLVALALFISWKLEFLKINAEPLALIIIVLIIIAIILGGRD